MRAAVTSVTLALLLVLVWQAGLDAVAPARPDAVRPVPGQVRAGFDAPAHPYGPGHRGVDLAAAPGEPVRAVRAGTVRWAGGVAGATWITLDHGAGLETTYGDVVPSVTVGERVGAGAVIGALAPGRAHLDWGARWRGGPTRSYLDPLLLLTPVRPRLVAPSPAT